MMLALNLSHLFTLCISFYTLYRPLLFLSAFSQTNIFPEPHFTFNFICFCATHHSLSHSPCHLLTSISFLPELKHEVRLKRPNFPLRDCLSRDFLSDIWGVLAHFVRADVQPFLFSAKHLLVVQQIIVMNSYQIWTVRPFINVVLVPHSPG